MYIYVHICTNCRGVARWGHIVAATQIVIIRIKLLNFTG